MSARRRIRRSLPAVAIAGSAILAMPLPALAADPPKLPWEGPPVRVKPGSVVVTFAPGTTPVERRATHSALGVAPGRASRIDVVTLPPGLSVDAAIRRYEADPEVIAAEPDRYVTLTGIPNDTYFSQQWALHNTGQSHRRSAGGTASGTNDADVDASEAWDTPSPANEVVVAVIDSGVHIGHPDLDGSLWVNPDEPVNGVDDDGNNKIDDVNGWDFENGDRNPSPGTRRIDSHGTHVAGIVAAERGNTTGIAGVCDACRIMALRFDLSLGQEIQAIRYAVQQGADIINMSFGGPVWSLAEREAIADAGRAGVLTVVSAGNSSADNDIPFFPTESDFAPDFPASYTLPWILSVAASNHHDQYGYSTKCAANRPRWQCSFTSWGHDSVDVAAPGVDILSTVRPPTGNFPDPAYAVFDGTSMAAPLVAGVAGLVKDLHPEYGPVALKNAVMNSVDQPGSLTMTTRWAALLDISRSPIQGNFTRTQGRVNAAAALTAPTTNATPLTDGNVNGARRMARKSVRGRVGWPGDANDVFAKKLRGGRRYRVVLNGPANRDFDLWVWSPKVTEIYQFTITCFRRPRCPTITAVSTSLDADEAVTFRVRRTRRYFVQVQGFYSGGRYTLSVRRV
jgi:subtilisin family serine protease